MVEQLTKPEDCLLRSDEQFVMNALASAMSATWREGGASPDAYLDLAGRTVAVEVSRLTQHVRNEDGESVPRLSEDVGAFRIADDLNLALRDEIPDRVGVLLIMHAPIQNVRKTKQDLLNRIRQIFRTGDAVGSSLQLEIRGNNVQLSVHGGLDEDRKKVFAAVPNRHSSADIGRNAWEMLEERIRTKAQKCAAIAATMPVWLALFNDYEVLADAETYRCALRSIDVAHPFEQILLIGGGGSVTTIWLTDKTPN